MRRPIACGNMVRIGWGLFPKENSHPAAETEKAVPTEDELKEILRKLIGFYHSVEGMNNGRVFNPENVLDIGRVVEKYGDLLDLGVSSTPGLNFERASFLYLAAVRDAEEQGYFDKQEKEYSYLKAVYQEYRQEILGIEARLREKIQKDLWGL